MPAAPLRRIWAFEAGLSSADNPSIALGHVASPGRKPLHPSSASRSVPIQRPSTGFQQRGKPCQAFRGRWQCTCDAVEAAVPGTGSAARAERQQWVGASG